MDTDNPFQVPEDSQLIPAPIERTTLEKEREQGQITIEFRMEAEDFVDQSLTRSMGKSENKRKYLLLGLSLVLLPLSLYLMLLPDKAIRALAPFSLVVSVFGLLMSVLRKWLVKRALRRQTDRMSGSDMFGLQKLVLNKDKYIRLTEYTEYHVKWGHIREVSLDKKSIYIASNPLQAINIPLRNFKSPEDVDYFMEILRDYSGVPEG